MNDMEATLDNELDTMVDYLLAGEEIEFSDAVQEWYRKGYECQRIPQPTDLKPLRLAVKASVVERLVEVLNSPPRRGHQVVPEWCRSIKGLDEPLKLQSERLLVDEQFCEPFAKRNLLVLKNFMYFV
ncbi:MAG: hypothetical protein HY080_14100 [Gammaproteobacteria bacterium]|nr:hypothetical protein [Gammaproteobacteria bacterium]